tara:strand:- start:94 stop:600 length:507 start_codon:yes stop_codon:yes gene_type:complete
MIDKNKRFIFSVEDFLPKDELLHFQKLLPTLDLQHLNRDDGSNIHYGFGAFFDPKSEETTILKSRVKNVFHPQNDLKISECRVHMRHNHKEPLPHYDSNKYAFLLYLKGEPLLNNGTGFYNDEGNLYHHVGFMENTALFFNADKILHTGLQSFGESSPRYCINLFFEI